MLSKQGRAVWVATRTYGPDSGMVLTPSLYATVVALPHVVGRCFSSSPLLSNAIYHSVQLRCKTCQVTECSTSSTRQIVRAVFAARWPRTSADAILPSHRRVPRYRHGRVQ